MHRALVSLAATLFFATPAAANDGAFLGSGATAFPVGDEAIALDTETLMIRQSGPRVGYYVDHWRVEVKYGFRNTTDRPVTVQMGFPEWCENTPDNMEDDLLKRCTGWTIRDFTVKVDGKPGPKVIVKKAVKGQGPQATLDFHRVHTFEVTFAPGQRRTIEHTYRHATSLTSPWCSDLTYILRTGALWAGKMKSLDIVVETQARFTERPDYRKWIAGKPGRAAAKITEHGEGYRFEWAFQNVDPEDDLALSFCEPKTMLARAEAVDEVMAFEEGELAGMDAAQLRILRNTPYAAYGYTFKSADLLAHFAAKPWYRPRADFDPKWLSASAIERIALLKKLEKAAKARPSK